jgi:eukaryotic-like serine/threonine-protein kinase
MARLPTSLTTQIHHMDERRGDRFGRYEILSELGRGAVGVVYKARDPKINRVVAVKTFSLAGHPSEDEQDFRDRFVREAEAAGRLSHPGIVTIFDVGEEPDTRSPYIVMEYVGGRSLDKVLADNDNRLPLETALQLTHELAEALDCAHGQGVVHRDLKPANILITEDGHAKIADFGVAKLNLANQTLVGRTLGTPAFMSPEQLNGEPVDGRSDLFSLGVVLYTVLTGYRPFQGNSAMTVSFKVVNRDPIPATVLDTDLPPGLDYLIGRAMAKDPAQRYQRGMEMALDIQDLRAGRELWSRAKQAGSSIGAVTPPPTDKIKAPATATANRSAGLPRSLPKNLLAEKLLDTMNKKSIAAMLLFAGVALFALRVAPWAKPRPSAPRNQLEGRMAGPLALAPVTTAGKIESAVAADTPAANAPEEAPLPAAPMPEVSHSPAPIHKKLAKPHEVKVAASPKRIFSNSPTAAPIAPPATLDIEIEHKFPQAQLSIFVDSALTYTHPLEGVDKKRLVVFHSVQGHEFHAVQIPEGNHQIRATITTDPSAPDHSGVVTGNFVSGQEKMLHIHFDKHGEMSLSLE